MRPPNTSAGTWKQMDLPPPVGRIGKGVAAGQHRLHNPALEGAKILEAIVAVEEAPRFGGTFRER